MRTEPTRNNQIERKWHLVDVSDKVLGRVASDIAHLLRGKNKPYFVPNLDCGDYVVVINASKVAVTGKKENEKTYTRYSGYPSGLKTMTLGMLRTKRPQEIISRAVAGMLPKNKLRDQWLGKLYIYSDEKHPHGDKLKIKS